MKTVCSSETVKAAFARVRLFAAAACLMPAVSPDKLEDAHEAADAIVQDARGKTAESRVDNLGDFLPVPLLGVVVSSGGPAPEIKVILLTGKHSAIAAGKLGSSLPIYPLEEKGVEALTDAGLYDPKTGTLSDKQQAVNLLISVNLTIAAELLADTCDPLDTEGVAERGSDASEEA